LLIYWYDVDAVHFHTHDSKPDSWRNFWWKLILRLSVWNFDYEHKHDSLPILTWASDDNRLSLSQSITSFLKFPLSDDVLNTQWDGLDGGLLSQLSTIDFRYRGATYIYLIISFCGLVSYFHVTRGSVVTGFKGSSTSFVCLELSSQMDHQLFKHFNCMIGNGIARPTKFPLRMVSS
jgi:hypothetical protein